MTLATQWSLKDALYLRDNSEDYAFYARIDDDYSEVELIDDAGSLEGSPYLFGNEFGPTHLVFAYGESAAHEAWIDQEETISADDVHEAYGAYDRLLHLMQFIGHENDYTLRDFCNRWCKYYFQLAINGKDETLGESLPELIEGYEHQANCTGTGIVQVGHHSWIKEADTSLIFVGRKTAETTA